MDITIIAQGKLIYYFAIRFFSIMALWFEFLKTIEQAGIKQQIQFL
jgi:spore maturation protein SpmA